MRDYPRPVIVISRCIEHDACRWNGLMIANPAVRSLKEFVDFRPVCPEMEIGLGVPRKPVRIVELHGKRQLLQAETGREVSGSMKVFIEGFLDSVGEVDGFLLKDRSPSCGYKDVKIYPPGEKVSPLTGTGSGFFGGAVAERFGHLPVESEGRLTNLALREHFLLRVFTLASYRELRPGITMGKLVQFHAEHKLILMAYNQTVMREMGRVVAGGKSRSMEETAREYGLLLQRALAKQPRYTSHINVLMHALGYFSDKLGAREKKHFLETLELYRQRRVPLAVPAALLSSWIARFGEEYLAGQVYFSPYPPTLMEMSDSGKGR